ncbi:MAG: NlpC/P60 family protein [Deltaproteobacteria bacterium]
MTLHRILFSSLLMILLSPLVASAAPAVGISRIGYAIQIGAFAEVKNAERLTSKLQEKGIEAFYFKKENGLYAVRFGDFSRRDDARNIAKKLVSDKIIESYFIAPPSKTAKEQMLPPKVGHVTVKKTDKTDQMGYIAARTAERFVGIPYRWGGDTVVDGMDCSGFTRAVYNLCGVNIPRTSLEQFRVGQAVNKDELLDGDLVFFGNSERQITHVGIYVGENRFVHAPKRGDDIKITPITGNGFAKRFIGAKRYF